MTTRYTCNNWSRNNGCGRVHTDIHSANACCARTVAARVPMQAERADVEDDEVGDHRSWLYMTWARWHKDVPVKYVANLWFVDAHPPVSCGDSDLRDITLLRALSRVSDRSRLVDVFMDVRSRAEAGSISGFRAKRKALTWCNLIEECLKRGHEFYKARYDELRSGFDQQELAGLRLQSMCGALPENKHRIPHMQAPLLPSGYMWDIHGTPEQDGTMDYAGLMRRFQDMRDRWYTDAMGGDPVPSKPDPKPDPAPTPAPAPAPASPAVGDVAQQIAQLLTQGGSSMSPEDVRAIAEQSARDAIASAASDGTLTMRVEVTRPDMSKWEIPGDEALHDKFHDCVGWLRVGVPVFLRGPAGTGKSMLGRQLAEAFHLPFASMSLSGGTAEYHFTGSRLPDADGAFRHRTTPFLDLFENGGVMLLDEVDACDENVLLAINDGIANGLLPVPGRDDAPFASKHKDFMLVCAANTWGTGPSAVYVGRNQLDGAFLNRFGLVEVDYDPKLERALCPDMPELVTKWQRLRDEVRSAQLRRIISMRELQRLYLRAQADGWTVQRCLQEAVLAWTPDEIKSCKTVAEVVS